MVFLTYLQSCPILTRVHSMKCVSFLDIRALIFVHSQLDRTSSTHLCSSLQIRLLALVQCPDTNRSGLPLLFSLSLS